MNRNWCRIKSNIVAMASKAWTYYRAYLLAFFVVFLIAFITGIMTCAQYVDSIKTDNLINKYLYEFLTKERRVWSYVLILSIWFVGIVLCEVIFTRNKLVIVIDTLILALLSYITGFDACIVVTTLGLSGIVFGILVQGLLMVTILVLIIFVMAIVSKTVCLKKKTGCCSPLPSVWQPCCFLMLLGVGIIALYVVLLSIIHIFVIVD